MLKILDFLPDVLADVALISTPFLIVNYVRYLKVHGANRSRFVPLPAKFPLKSVLFFIGPVVVAIAAAEIVTTYCREDTLNFLRDLSGNYQVQVDAQPAREPNGVVAALRQVAPLLGHHSHPTKMIRIDIEGDRGSLTLQLGRDSDYAQEYWVFNPKYRVTSNNEIGRITTAIFDGY